MALDQQIATQIEDIGQKSRLLFSADKFVDFSTTVAAYPSLDRYRGDNDADRDDGCKSDCKSVDRAEIDLRWLSEHSLAAQMRTDLAQTQDLDGVSLAHKRKMEYSGAQSLPLSIIERRHRVLNTGALSKVPTAAALLGPSIGPSEKVSKLNNQPQVAIEHRPVPKLDTVNEKSLVLQSEANRAIGKRSEATIGAGLDGTLSALAIRRKHLENSTLAVKTERQAIRPEWHPPWKLMRVIAGHLGWVRCLDVEPGNQWFCSGAGDRTIKVWDLASGALKVTLTGHIAAVRGVAVSPRHPYLFSCGEDKLVKCWDLETNKVIRHYHGHLSGVYALNLHPTLDVLVTSGRDAVARVWDIRTKQCVHVLSGHTGTVCAVKCQATDPQVITGSMDKQIRLWDLAAGKTMAVLTHHKKSVRGFALHPSEYSFASASAENIKQWKFPEGNFMQNFDPHNSIVNTLSVNVDGVMFSGADNGSMQFYDWRSGHCFQHLQTIVQPGSLDSEAGIFTSCFDQTGLRLITGEADKSIKIYKEDQSATEDTHPLDWQPSLERHKY